MRLAHCALWTSDLERLKDFYVRYFDAKPSAQYVNEKKGFQSYFLTFAGEARLELMQRADVANRGGEPSAEYLGYAHIAMTVGSEREVDRLTQRLIEDGYTRLDGPRRTGDGYYESVILDPDGNRIEITA